MEPVYIVRGRMSMSAIIPMGYTRKRIGVFLAIVVVVGAGASISVFLVNGASFADVKYLCIGAIVLALLCVLSDVTTNLRNKKKTTPQISALQNLL